MAGMTLVVVLLMCAHVASAQTTTQLWGNLTFNSVKSERLVYVTPNVEYALRPPFDLVAAMTLGRTLQTDAVHSTEMTPRFGVRFHLFSRTQLFRVLEQAPRRRLVVRDLVRVESRNFFYSGGDTDSDSTVRFRNRLEFLVPGAVGCATVMTEGIEALG
jgi:hypothetical protein